jgi:hypothetical protein
MYPLLGEGLPDDAHESSHWIIRLGIHALAVQGDPNELQPELCGRFEDSFDRFPLKTRYHEKPLFVLYKFKLRVQI